jgi:phosphatidylinositol-3-phosphatase
MARQYSGHNGKLASRACSITAGITLLLLASAWAAPGSLGTAASAASAPRIGLTVAATPVFPTNITHVIMIIEENQEWSEVWNYGPYQVSLAREYANLSQFYALHQSSYSAYAAQTSGYNTTAPPKPINVTSLADRVTVAGETWKEWAESAPSACDRSAATPYSIKHVPFVWYDDIYANSTECNADVIPMTLAQMQTDLSTGTNVPNFLLITPNQYDDGDMYHAACGGGAVNHTQAEEVCTDAWLSKLLPSLFSNTALFDTTAVLISYDQTSTADDSGSIVGADGGHVYAAIVSPFAKSGYNSATPYTAYNMLTTTEWLLGLPGGTLENDKWSVRPPIEGAFSASSPTYGVTFTETGLPTGTNWSATLGGATQSSTNSTITFIETAGTYTYRIGTVEGWISSPSSGSLGVNGPNVNQAVTFTEGSNPTQVAFVDMVTSPVESPLFSSLPGDTIVVFFGLNGKNTVTSITDSNGDSFALLNYFLETESSGSHGAALYMATDVAGGSSTTVTVQTSHTSSTSTAVLVVDITNVAPQQPDYQSAVATGVQSATFSNAVSATAGDTVLGFISSGGYNGWTASGGDTRLNIVTTPKAGTHQTAADFNYSAPNNASVTMAGISNKSVNWIAESLSLKPLSSVPSPPGTHLVTRDESRRLAQPLWNRILEGVAILAGKSG